jgi:hypothetical protein
VAIDDFDGGRQAAVAAQLLVVGAQLLPVALADEARGRVVAALAEPLARRSRNRSSRGCR